MDNNNKQKENKQTSHNTQQSNKSNSKVKTLLNKINTYFSKTKSHVNKQKKIYNPVFNLILAFFFIFIFILPLAGTINITVENDLGLDEATLLKEKLDYIFNSNQKRVNALIKYCKRHNIPPLFAASVIFTESTNKTLATSYVNARGLMQLMSKTAIVLAKATGDEKLAGAIKKNPNLLYDADINIFLGTYFLKDLKRQYKGDWSSALHAYNVGPYAFKKGKRNPHYVNRIMRFYSDWTNMNLEQIHKKYSAFLFNLYKKKNKLIGPE